MALCPKCYGILNFWDVKAECPHCGTNIPNYNWEQRLDDDAAHAEIAWKKFRRFTGNLKSALFGSKFRILRFVCTFLPLVVLILPLAEFSVNLPFVNADEQTFTLLEFSMNTLLKLNWGSLLNIISSQSLGAPVIMLIASLLCLYLAVVFGVLNFVFILIKAPSLKAGANIVLCLLSDLCFASAGVLFTIAASLIRNNSVAFLSGNIQFGLFVGIALFTLNVILNIATNKSFKKELSLQSEI